MLNIRESLYWDNFSKRIDSTVECINNNTQPSIDRVAVFITEKCNLNCKYCNSKITSNEMSEDVFDKIAKKYSNAIIHITGGEPSVVKWLYPYLIANGNDYTFHLNTNAIIPIPAKHIKRLKISLDSCDSIYWDELVGRRGAFDLVIKNIKNAIPDTVTSITYTITKENYKYIPRFIDFVNKELSGLYAIFFSVYKGSDSRFVISDECATDFFDNIKPYMDEHLDEESRALLNETIEEKFRVMQGVRFPENGNGICYISLSEVVVNWDGSTSACSHLFRDGIFNKPGVKDIVKCKYGCNRRLVEFNNIVKLRLVK